MTYQANSPIIAQDYRDFAYTVGSGINEVYADLHPGSVPAIPGSFSMTDVCGLGYGQTSIVDTSLNPADPILAVEWRNLFKTIRDCATHQGSLLPAALPWNDPAYPVPGDPIIAFPPPAGTTPPPDVGSLAGIIARMKASRFSIDIATQTAIVPFAPLVQPAANWTNTLTCLYTVDFGSWDQARYFFNTGSWIRLRASMTGSTPEEVAWQSMFTQMNPLLFNFASCHTEGPVFGDSWGFYDMLSSFREIYRLSYGVGGAYAANLITIEAKISAGVNGRVDFRIILDNNDPTPSVKTGKTTYSLELVKTANAITWPFTATLINTSFAAT